MKNLNCKRNGTCAAFTLKELLVVLAVLALLACVALPALARVRAQTAMAQCSDNLRRFTLAMRIYGNDNNDQVYQWPSSSGTWAFDIPAALRDKLAQYGMQRAHFYCPANTNQNQDTLWNFAPTQYSIIGYALTLPNSAINPGEPNFTLTPPVTSLGIFRLAPASPAQRVLLADMTLCAAVSNPSQSNAPTYNWTHIAGGATIFHTTSHMGTRTNLPLGGNVGMLDGHVEWKPFAQMLPRSTSGSTPVFWW